ncbi:MAG TPA: lysophospholipid acyltransferase family protein [Gemmatimonadaceae bacterium]
MTERLPDDTASGRGRRFRVAVVSALGGLIIRLLGLTWRVRRVGGETFDAMLHRGEPFIVVFWHGEIVPVTWVHRHRGIAPLISRHADGEVISRIVEGLGYRTVRGSTTRGGVRALLETAQRVKEGFTVGFTPDGPRGPRHVFAPGALIVAQRTGRPIVALGATASRAWRLRSWDRHLVPKPFATVTIRYSEPQYVRTAQARDAVQEQARFEEILGSLADRS